MNGIWRPLLRSFFFAIFLSETFASPPIQAIRSQPRLPSTKHSLQIRQSSSQQDPSTIAWPPDCTTSDPDSCLGSKAISSCTEEACQKKVAATCWHHVYFIDFSCLCPSMSSSTCTSCLDGGINEALYFTWLSQYCIKSPGWNGLSSNWQKNLPAFEVLQTGQVNAVNEQDPGNPQTQNPFTSQFITDKHTVLDNHHVPTCISGCNWFNDRWLNAWVDGDVVYGLVSGGFSPTYGLGGQLQYGNLYIDLSNFCGNWKWSDLQTGCQNSCTQDLDPTSLLLWLNSTCGQVSGFAGLPSDWKDDILVPNATFVSSVPGPHCLQASSGNSSNCDFQGTLSKCTTQVCGSQDQNGDCSPTTTYNLKCFCSDFQYSDCIAGGGDCSSGTQMTGFLVWLNATCSTVSGFPGMPQDWQASLLLPKSSYVTPFSGPNCLQGSGNSSDCNISAAISKSTTEICKSVDQDGNCNTITDINIDRSCSSVHYTGCIASDGQCSSGLAETGLLLWLYNRCGNNTGFSGMPKDWGNSLAFINNTYAAIDSFPWPSCANGQKYSDCQLQGLESSCTRTLCNGTDANGNCYPASMVSLPCFCSQTRYGTSCTEECGLSWQRAEFLDWMNDTCSSQVAPGTSLPLNWTDYLSVQRSDLLLSGWKDLAASSLTIFPLGEDSPSASGSLVAFAVVNLFIIVLLIGIFTLFPILASRFKRGCLGHQGSQRWYLTSPLIVVLQIISNAINAAIVKSKFGSPHVDITELTFLWCTRPQISWIFVTFLPFCENKSRPLFLSAILAIVGSQLLLQLIVAYFMGTSIDFARRQKFYVADGRLDENDYTKHARIMYSGALLWVFVFPFFLLAGSWILLRGKERLGGFGQKWTESRTAARERVVLGKGEIKKLEKLQTSDEAEGQDHLSSQIQTVIEEWEELIDNWRALPNNLQNHYLVQIQSEAQRTLSHPHKRTAAQQRQRTLRNQIALNAEENRRDVHGSRGSWEKFVRRKQALLENWVAYEEQWDMIPETRDSVGIKTQERREGIPFTAVVFLIATTFVYIAQWLWWGGFVAVAGDGYSPPLLPLLAFIWIVFEGIGLLIGAAF